MNEVDGLIGGWHTGGMSDGVQLIPGGLLVWSGRAGQVEGGSHQGVEWRPSREGEAVVLPSYGSLWVEVVFF